MPRVVDRIQETGHYGQEYRRQGTNRIEETGHKGQGYRRWGYRDKCI
jgi:hypothetical protein